MPDMTEYRNIFDAETDESEMEREYPFNPDEISIDKKNMLVETCIKRMMQKSIVLNPDFQRHEVWDNVRKSRLIESLMLKIPIPMFYVSSDERSIFTVVDGLQRLSSLRDFILGKDYLDTGDEDSKGNGLKLQSLEFWTQYNGYTFKQLPTYLQNRITETELTFTIINPGTPEDVKRNIFKRINTGGLYLTAQEIRNALYTGQSTKLLNSLAAASEFIQATGHAINSKRMEDIDVILRCISFIVRDKEFYPKNSSMDNFLSDTMQIINAYPDYSTNDLRKLYRRGNVIEGSFRRQSPQELENLFRTGMSRSFELFGKHCFRKSHGNKKRSPVNKALFEMWGSLLPRLTETEFNNIKVRSSDFCAEYYDMLDNIDFQNLISRDSWKYPSLQKRFDRIITLIDKYKGGNI